MRFVLIAALLAPLAAEAQGIPRNPRSGMSYIAGPWSASADGSTAVTAVQAAGSLGAVMGYGDAESAPAGVGGIGVIGALSARGDVNVTLAPVFGVGRVSLGSSAFPRTPKLTGPLQAPALTPAVLTPYLKVD